MEETLYLTELIDISILQEMQDSFTKMTKIAAFITDGKGGHVTEGSRLSDFCMKFTRAVPEGCKRCNACDINSAQAAYQNGSVVTYHCHTGLMNFAAPIIIDGKLIACFHGGQFLNLPPDDKKLAKIAVELGLDPDAYILAYHKLPILEQSQIRRACLFLHTITDALSSIAYHNYVILEENAKIRRATNLKSDFLANMSHEIRTPMNAIIGMAEMALREELPIAAHDYVSQIKSSGKNLLMIINDILDFSKMESGKMEINMTEYAPMSLINDVANIMMTHIGKKDVQLILDVSPDIPLELLGDSLRIKQILVNLSNNAIKFTKKGYITVKIEPSWRSEDEVIMNVSVEDTGIGIKKADKAKLFQSFQQLDSKRNRNLEGTGLGLAISQRLLHLMMGSINVESEYGKGSTFSFQLPQRITRAKPSITLKNPAPSTAAGLISDPVFHAQLRKDIVRLSIHYTALEFEEDLISLKDQQCEFLFIEHPMFSETVKNFVREHPEIVCVLIIDFYESAALYQDLPQMLVVKKPIYSLNLSMIFNKENLHAKYSNVTDEDYEFIAPEAKILIVDDNAVNLTVAEGLLKPLQLKIDTALSGKEAIKMIASKQYDLIFMDHQMPELNGIETTHIIRRFHEEYTSVPIIAFSANSSTEIEMMFLNEGLNDCVGKPFELRILISKLKRWLPKEKIQKINEEQKPQQTEPENVSISIEGLDTQAALKLLGSEKLLWVVLKDYYKVIRCKAEKIHALEQQEDWKNYTIEVHALKSASRQIGATELASLAADMEKAGNDKNAALIHQHTAYLLEQYLHFDHILAPYFMEQNDSTENQEPIPPETLRQAFENLRGAMEELNMDGMDSVIQDLAPYYYENEQLELYKKLKNAVEELDVDSCASILSEWEQQLDKQVTQ